MNKLHTIVLLICFAGSCVGCGGMFPTDDAQDAPVVAKDNVWEYVARQTEKGNVDNTDQLILLVSRLREQNSLTEADVTAFYKAFPDVKAKSRPVDVRADAMTLRGL